MTCLILFPRSGTSRTRVSWRYLLSLIRGSRTLCRLFIRQSLKCNLRRPWSLVLPHSRMQDREGRQGPGGSLAPDSASLPSPRNPPEKRTSEGTAASAQKVAGSLRPPSLRLQTNRASLQVIWLRQIQLCCLFKCLLGAIHPTKVSLPQRGKPNC